MPTLISGSTGVNKIQDGTIVNADINSSAAIAGTKLVMPTGSVLQVVEATNATYIAFADDWNWDLVVSRTITLSSTSSRVLIMVHFGGCSVADGTTGNYPALKGRVLRGSTEIGMEEGYMLYHNASEIHRMGNFDLQGIDSPGTTSELTYNVEAGNNGGSSKSGVYSGSINRSGGKTKIILVEIGG